MSINRDKYRAEGWVLLLALLLTLGGLYWIYRSRDYPPPTEDRRLPSPPPVERAPMSGARAETGTATRCEPWFPDACPMSLVCNPAGYCVKPKGQGPRKAKQRREKRSRNYQPETC